MRRLLSVLMLSTLVGCGGGPPGGPHDVIERLRERGAEQDWDGMLALVAPADRARFAQHLLISASLLAGFGDAEARAELDGLLDTYGCVPPAHLPGDSTALQSFAQAFPADLASDALARDCLGYLYRRGSQATPALADGSLRELRRVPGGALAWLGGSELAFVELDDVWYLAVP